MQVRKRSHEHLAAMEEVMMMAAAACAMSAALEGRGMAKGLAVEVRQQREQVARLAGTTLVAAALVQAPAPVIKERPGGLVEVRWRLWTAIQASMRKGVKARLQREVLPGPRLLMGVARGCRAMEIPRVKSMLASRTREKSASLS